jgi:hypothetical protein
MRRSYNLPQTSVLYGEEDRERAKADKRRTSVVTLKDLVAPQRVELFTLHYDLIPLEKRHHAKSNARPNWSRRQHYPRYLS